MRAIPSGEVVVVICESIKAATGVREEEGRTSPRRALTTHSETFCTINSIRAFVSPSFRAFVFVCLPFGRRAALVDGAERTRSETSEAKVRLSERSCASACSTRQSHPTAK
mgnify:FL=1